jgi:hypothetical protein
LALAPEGPLEAVDHAVKGGRQAAELVVRQPQRQAPGQVLGADPFGRAGDAVDRRQRPSGQEVAAAPGQRQRHQQANPAQQPQPIEDRLDLGQRPTDLNHADDLVLLADRLHVEADAARVRRGRRGILGPVGQDRSDRRRVDGRQARRALVVEDRPPAAVPQADDVQPGRHPRQPRAGPAPGQEQPSLDHVDFRLDRRGPGAQQLVGVGVQRPLHQPQRQTAQGELGGAQQQDVPQRQAGPGRQPARGELHADPSCRR